MTITTSDSLLTYLPLLPPTFNPFWMSVLGPSPKLLDELAPRAARIVALELLASAAAARDRLDDHDDAEALHDFRVAVRRLRSWLRALQPWLDDSVRPKRRRQLRRVARVTNQARDAEVHLAWLAAQHNLSRGKRAAGVHWLEHRLELERADADASSISKAAALFDRLHEPLARALGSYTVTCRVDDPNCVPSIARAMAPLVLDHASTLQQRFAAVSTIDDDAPIHAARIAAKRLRYLLEPVAEELEGAPELIDLLRELQTSLGDVHDAHVFAAQVAHDAKDAAVHDTRSSDEVVAGDEATSGRKARQAGRPDTGPGLKAIAQRVRKDAEEHFAAFAAIWLDGKAEQFFIEVEALASRLELGSDVPVEIERKFLLDSLPDAARLATPERIEQGYLPGTELVERVRRVTAADGGIRYWRTVKFGTGVSRFELEEETTRAVFQALWPLTEGRRVDKHRHVVPDGAHKWEIDGFAGRDLVLAEVELESEGEEVTIPDWLAPHVVREVTGEDAYVNANLAS